MNARLREGELILENGVLCFGDMSEDGVVRPTRLEDLSVYETRFGRFASGVARLLTQRLLTPSAANVLEGFVWPVSKRGHRLKPHQEYCLRDIIQNKNGRGLITLPMGFGKTVVAVLAAYYYGGPVLNVLPSDKKVDFVRHYDDWTDGKFKHIRMLKSKKEAIEFLTTFPVRDRSSCVLCISFALASDSAVLEALNRWFFRVVIVDEAHEIKNASSKRAHAIFKLSRKSACCLLMTGTPVMNRGSELYAPLHCLFPETFPQFFGFSERYCNGRCVMGRWQEIGLTRLHELHTINQATIVNATPEQIAEVEASLPDKDRTLIDLPKPSDSFVREFEVLDQEHDELLKEYHAAKDAYSKERAERKRQAVSGKMRKLTSVAKLIPVAEYVSKMVVPKLGDGQSAVVFCSFVEFATDLKAELMRRGHDSVVITGETEPNRRQAMLEPFKLGTRKDSCKLVLLSIKASYKGIELAPGVTQVVFAELDYTPAVMDQAEARAHRMGATASISSTWLILRPSYDVGILSMIHTKQITQTRVLTAPTK
jgi:SWI/SNF-related matrix-associated actin-dependent regulator of chromatin subfamily A-like protein 1